MSKKLQKKDSRQMELNLPISSQEVSPANRSRLQENKKEQVTTDISGLRCFESSKSLPRGGLLEKMSKVLLTSKTAWSSRLCALTWKERDTKSGRSIFQLQASAPRIDAKESGLLPTEKNLWSTPTTFDSNNIQQPRKKHPGGGQVPPLNQQVMWSTPTTMDHLPQRSEEALRRQATTTRKGRTRPANLREQVDENAMRIWRTPDAHCDRGTELREKNEDETRKGNANQHQRSGSPSESDVANADGGRSHEQEHEIQAGRNIPISSSEDVADTESSPRHDHEAVAGNGGNLRHKKYLETEVAYVEKAPGGTLNPTWVEWLMGYPAGYTDLKDWEILSSRKSRKKLATPLSKQKEKNEH